MHNKGEIMRGLPVLLATRRNCFEVAELEAHEFNERSPSWNRHRQHLVVNGAEFVLKIHFRNKASSFSLELFFSRVPLHEYLLMSLHAFLSGPVKSPSGNLGSEHGYFAELGCNFNIFAAQDRITLRSQSFGPNCFAPENYVLCRVYGLGRIKEIIHNQRQVCGKVRLNGLDVRRSLSL